MERAYVGHLENGRRNISLHTMWQLADALRVTPADFFADAVKLADTPQPMEHRTTSQR